LTLLLAVVGVGVVVLGAVVLLLLPDRPGGTIGWGGMQVKSKGAGLPLIVVGLVAVGFALNRGHEDSAPAPPTDTAGSVRAAWEFDPDSRNRWTAGTYAAEGTLQLQAHRTENSSVFASPPAGAPRVENAEFSVSARRVGGSAEKGYGYGIFCRETDSDTLYTFTLWANIAVLTRRVEGVVDPDVLAKTETLGAAQYGDAGLQLHADCASHDGGGTLDLKFWVTKDGKPEGDVLEATDPTPLDGSAYGLFATLGNGGGSPDDTLVVQFDDFIVGNSA
jgi:hypothetical protein